MIWAWESLTAFGDNLRRRRWTSCPCGDRHEHEEMDTALLRAVQKDLRLLARGTLTIARGDGPAGDHSA